MDGRKKVGFKIRLTVLLKHFPIVNTGLAKYVCLEVKCL